MNTLSRSKSGSSRRGRSREPKRSFDDSDNSFESWESASSSDDDTYEPESNPQIAYKASTEYESDEGSASYVSDSEPPTPRSTDHSEYDSDSLQEDANIVSMDSMGSHSRGSDDDSEGSSTSGEEFADATSVPSEGSEDDEADEDSFGEFDTEDDRFKNTKSFADDDDDDDESETDNGDEEEVKLGKTDDELFWKRYGYSQNVGGTFGDDSKATGSVDVGDEETEASNRTGSAKSSEFDDGDTFKDELYTQAFPSIARMRTEDSREEIEDPERSFSNNQNGGMLDNAKNWLQSNVEKLKDTYNNQRSESPRSNSWFDLSDVLKGNFKWYFLGVILIILIAIIAGTTSKKRKRNSTNPALTPTMPPTLFPTAMPSPMPTAAATLPSDQVMESITFFSLVPNGKEIGVTEMDMEFDFIAIFNVLAPQVLFNTTNNSTNEDRISVDSLGLRGRIRRRTLKALSLKSTSIDTTSIDCPELPSVNASDLCFRTRADIAVMTDDGSIGFDYATAMKDAINSGEIQTLSDEYNLNLTITILDVADIVTASPTTSPVCVDTEVDCEFWAKQEPSQCVVNPDYMLVYCAKSCDSCVTNAPTTAPPTIAPSASPTASPTANTTSAPTFNPTSAPPTSTPPTTTSVSCFDKNEACAESMGGVCLFTKCEVWAKEGECENNPTYMWSNCAKSCDQCVVDPAPTDSPTLSDDYATMTQAPTIVGCVDSNSECPSWASQDECTNNPNWMLENCKLSCNSCDSNVDPTCVDSNAECSGWASSGECTSNPVWMLTNCQKSCNSCESDNDDTTGDATGDTTDDATDDATGDTVDDTDDNAEESPDPLCIDNDERCTEWAAADQCESNPNWMLVNCELSCNVCEIKIDSSTDRDENSGEADCVDLNESCRVTSASGDCELTKCGFWASEGECDNNPSYMLENCSKSCGKCETLGV